MKTKIAISTLIVFFIGLMIGPPDMITQLSLGIGAGFLCAASLLILAGRGFMKSASKQVQTRMALP
ncbi:MAG TPA: hypothetical protein VLI39_05480 [Sedimentisphaerales bacterium]|nr:hypothetical protein [Sedimentisphaerales bacterium]